MTIQQCIPQLQKHHKEYDNPIIFNSKYFITNYVVDKERGVMLIAGREDDSYITPHELLRELHKWKNYIFEIYIADEEDLRYFKIDSIGTVQFDPDTPSCINLISNN